jgi:hypothetical protein
MYPDFEPHLTEKNVFLVVLLHSAALSASFSTMLPCASGSMMALLASDGLLRKFTSEELIVQALLPMAMALVMDL